MRIPVQKSTFLLFALVVCLGASPMQCGAPAGGYNLSALGGGGFGGGCNQSPLQIMAQMSVVGMGASDPITATFMNNDGTTANVTSNVTWNLTNTSVGTMTTSGSFQASASVGGMDWVSASYIDTSGHNFMSCQIPITVTGPIMTAPAMTPSMAAIRPGTSPPEIWVTDSGSTGFTVITWYGNGGPAPSISQYSITGVTGSPDQIVFSNSHAFIGMGSSGFVAVVDQNLKSTVGSINLMGTPTQLAVAPDGAVFATVPTGTGLGVWKIDPALLTASVVITTAVIPGPSGIAFVPGGSGQFWVSSNSGGTTEKVYLMNYSVGAVAGPSASLAGSAGYLAGDLYIDPYAAWLYAASGTGGTMTMESAATAVTASPSFSPTGGIAFFSDPLPSYRFLMSGSTSYTVYTNTSGAVTAGASIAVTPSGLGIAAITPDHVLILPSGSSITIYQYY